MKKWIAFILALLMLVPAVLAESEQDMVALTLDSVKWCVQLPKDSQVKKAVVYSCEDFEGYPVEALLIAATPSEEAQAYRGAAAGLLLVDLSDGKVYTDSDFPVFEGQPVQSREDVLLWLFNSWASNWYQDNLRLWTENETCVMLTAEELQYVNEQLVKYFTAPGFSVPIEPPMAAEPETDATDMQVVNPENEPEDVPQAEESTPAEPPAEVEATVEPVEAEPVVQEEAVPEAAPAEEIVDRGEFGWAGTWIPYSYADFQGSFVVYPDNTCEIDGRVMRMEQRNKDRTDLFKLFEGDAEVGYLVFIPDQRSVQVVIGEGPEAYVQNFCAEWMYEKIDLTAENLLEYFELREDWEFVYDLFDEVEGVRYKQTLQLKPEYGLPEWLLSEVAVEYSSVEACYDCVIDADAQRAERQGERWRRDPNTRQTSMRAITREDDTQVYGQMLTQTRVYDDDGLCVTGVTDLEILRVKGSLYIPIEQ